MPLWALWEDGWEVLFRSISELQSADLQRTEQLRAVPLTVTAALQRSLAHVAYHVGQIVLLARQATGAHWKPLSLPPGQSGQYNQNPTLERGPNPKFARACASARVLVSGEVLE